MLPAFHNSKRRIGFTLIELLMVISIIAILSGLALAALRGAREDARQAATLATISRIQAILELKFEEFEFQKLPIRLRSYVSSSPKPDGSSGSVPSAVQTRNLKRRIIADFINAEMPQPKWEYRGRLNIPVVNQNPFYPDYIPCFNFSIGSFPTYYGAEDSSFGAKDLDPRNSDPTISFSEWLDQNYGPALGLDLSNRQSSAIRRWQTKYALKPANWDDELGGFKIGLNLPAEFLYVILSFSTFDDTNGLEALGPGAIGDSDNDGIPEIVDSWGDPLHFEIRQLGFPFANDLVTTQLETDPRRFDPLAKTGTEIDYANPTTGKDIFENDGQSSGLLNPIIPSPFDEIIVILRSQNF